MSLAEHLIDAMIEWIDREVPRGALIQTDEVVRELALFNRTALEAVAVPEGKEHLVSRKRMRKAYDAVYGGLKEAADLLAEAWQDHAGHLKVVRHGG